MTWYRNYYRRLKGKTKHGEPHVWERMAFHGGPLAPPTANAELESLREDNGEEYSYALAIDTADTTVNKENAGPYVQPTPHWTGVVYTHYFVRSDKSAPTRTRTAFVKPRNHEESMAKINRWNKAAQWARYALDENSCETAVSLLKDAKQPFDPTDYATQVLGIAVLPKGMAKIHAGEVVIAPVPLKIVRKPGDVWRLPKTNSPMWTEQWGYQGSAKAPYIISRKTGTVAGTPLEWACSCPNWTRNVPRTNCKHILSVRLKEKMPAEKKTIPGITSDQQKEFEKWQREKAAAGAPVTKSEDTGLNLFGATGRKFR